MRRIRTFNLIVLFLWPTLALVTVLLPAIVVKLVKASTRPVDPERAAINYLLGTQGNDGAWHSTILTGRPENPPSPGLTALVLVAITSQGVERREARAQVDHGFAYLMTNTDAQGCVGTEKDFPNYATALTVMALLQWKPVEYERSVDRLVKYLIKAQLDEGEGWKEDEPQFGGWDLGRPQDRQARREDISVTSYVLEALAAAKVPKDHACFKKARIFLDRCRNADGGFNFAPGVGKAATDNEPLRSYGSATCDGLRALRAAGLDAAGTTKWVDEHRTVEKNPGFVRPTDAHWDKAVFYYYLRSLAAVSPGRDIARKLESLQQSDGSWKNDEPAMKEHDPVAATALALWTLRLCR